MIRTRLVFVLALLALGVLVACSSSGPSSDASDAVPADASDVAPDLDAAADADAPHPDLPGDPGAEADLSHADAEALGSQLTIFSA